MTGVEGEYTWVGISRYADVLTNFRTQDKSLFLPSQNDVTYTSYGLRIDLTDYKGMFVIRNASNDPVTLGNVKGDFSWTASFSIGGQEVYSKSFAFNGVDMNVNGQVLEGGTKSVTEAQRFYSPFAGSESIYIDLMDYIVDSDVAPSTNIFDQPQLQWTLHFDTANIYDADTGSPINVGGLVLYDRNANALVTVNYEANYETKAGGGSTPEPATLLIFGAGLAGMCLAKARRANRRKRNA